VRWVVERCLAKDAAERYDSTRDLYRELKMARERLSEASGSQVAATPTTHRPLARLWIAFAGLAIAAATFGATTFMSHAPSPSWDGVMLGGSEIALNPRLSPDGHLLAFEAMVDGVTQMAVMKPETGNWSLLTRERNHGSVVNHSWSPDGTLIYYDRYADVAQGIFSVPVLGGDERLVLDNAFAPELLPDGSMLIVKQNTDRQFQLHRFWPATGRLKALPFLTAQDFFSVRARAFTVGMAAVVWGEPLGKASASTALYRIDVSTGETRRLESQAMVGAEGGQELFSVSGRYVDRQHRAWRRADEHHPHSSQRRRARYTVAERDQQRLGFLMQDRAAAFTPAWWTGRRTSSGSGPTEAASNASRAFHKSPTSRR
jgi:hypothetical protein